MRNLLLHCDNLVGLNYLLQSFKSKIKCIYIDPPYNTGSNSLTYDDRSDVIEWLKMMDARLTVARKLLRDDGVIFITIDDNQVYELKLLMDSIFGRENFIANILWKSRDSVSNDAIISRNHNYNLVYAKYASRIRSSLGIANFRLPPNEKEFSNPDGDRRGAWKSMHLEVSGVRISKGLLYKIRDPKGRVFFPKPGACWRFSQETFRKYLREGRILFDPNGKRKPRYKVYRNEVLSTPTSWWDDVGTTTEGTRTLTAMFGRKVYTNPKPVSLIKKILRLCTDKNSIVLDFFAGSGTTGHAVIELNHEDGGRRKFILIEKEDCFETVLVPRINKLRRSLRWKNGKPLDTRGARFGVKCLTLKA